MILSVNQIKAIAICLPATFPSLVPENVNLNHRYYLYHFCLTIIIALLYYSDNYFYVISTRQTELFIFTTIKDNFE